MKYYRIKLSWHTWISKDPYDNYEKWHHHVVEQIVSDITGEKPEIQEITKEEFEEEGK